MLRRYRMPGWLSDRSRLAVNVRVQSKTETISCFAEQKNAGGTTNFSDLEPLAGALAGLAGSMSEALSIVLGFRHEP